VQTATHLRDAAARIDDLETQLADAQRLVGEAHRIVREERDASLTRLRRAHGWIATSGWGTRLACAEELLRAFAAAGITEPEEPTDA
jgi:hypothetical protein